MKALLPILISLTLLPSLAEARSYHRSSNAHDRSPGSGGGSCGNVDLNCDSHQGRIGSGAPFRIVCGEGVTSRGKRHSITPSKNVAIGAMLSASGGILPKGTPMMSTSPAFCGNCFINGLSTNARSTWGCIRTGAAFAQLRHCGRGTHIKITHNRPATGNSLKLANARVGR